jgi:LmbE family N-acetylglucosaminyl deacetylase
VTRAITAIFAHPDDEVFTVGGTIARYAGRGVRCSLYCATDGDAGRSSGLEMSSRGALGATRREELRRGAAILGFETIHFAGLPDGALGAGDQDALVEDIVRRLRTWRPEVVVTFGPEGAPNVHRDHRAISRAATSAFFVAGIPTVHADQIAEGLAPHAARRLFYVAWPDPPADAELPARSLPITAAVDTTPYLDTKRRSFLEHATQRDHLGRFERLALTGAEHFHLAAGTPQPSAMIGDLFEGLGPD